ncbi:MAG: SoxR reducing system RseC family protein [Chlorobi bacterium]|nr:SoxR reducing system RseC family protein [Chlorobiota bacterium]
MDSERIIEHEGTVKQIHDGRITVGFIAKSACATCHLKGFCSASDLQDKEVEVWQGDHQVTVGEKVNIVLAQKLGIKALMIGYIFPFFLVIIALFVSYLITDDELVIGLISLAVLIPYYWGLYLLRSRIGKKYNFQIRKLV